MENSGSVCFKRGIDRAKNLITNPVVMREIVEREECNKPVDR